VDKAGLLPSAPTFAQTRHWRHSRTRYLFQPATIENRRFFGSDNYSDAGGDEGCRNRPFFVGGATVQA
jgi:hypothetical protein